MLPYLFGPLSFDSYVEFQSMIVDQTIEKVSFCAPDRNHEKGFAYICRDGTTRRWMCHGFLAVKESVSCQSYYKKIFFCILVFVCNQILIAIIIQFCEPITVKAIFKSYIFTCPLMDIWGTLF